MALKGRAIPQTDYYGWAFSLGRAGNTGTFHKSTPGLYLGTAVCPARSSPGSRVQRIFTPLGRNHDG